MYSGKSRHRIKLVYNLPRWNLFKSYRNNGKCNKKFPDLNSRFLLIQDWPLGAFLNCKVQTNKVYPLSRNIFGTFFISMSIV